MVTKVLKYCVQMINSTSHVLSVDVVLLVESRVSSRSASFQTELSGLQIYFLSLHKLRFIKVTPRLKCFYCTAALALCILAPCMFRSFHTWTKKQKTCIYRNECVVLHPFIHTYLSLQGCGSWLSLDERWKPLNYLWMYTRHSSAAAMKSPKLCFLFLYIWTPQFKSLTLNTSANLFHRAVFEPRSWCEFSLKDAWSHFKSEFNSCPTRVSACGPQWKQVSDDSLLQSSIHEVLA